MINFVKILYHLIKARVSALDYDIGQVVGSLKYHGLYNNSVIIFVSDVRIRSLQYLQLSMKRSLYWFHP